MTPTSRSAPAPVGIALGALAAGVAILMTATGAPAAIAGMQAGVVTVQAATGILCWLLIRRTGASIIEHVGMGLALGTLLAVLSGVLLRPVSPAWGWAVPTAVIVIVALLVLPRRRPTVVVDGMEGRSLAVTLGAGVLLLVTSVIRAPLPTDRITSTLHPDLPFFQTLANGLARFGPGDSLLMSGTQIRYHWLSYAWTGQLDLVSGAAPFQVLTRLVPLVAFVALGCLSVAWARRMSDVPWVPALAGLLVLLSGFVGARFGVLTNVDSPSQMFSLMWLLALVLTLVGYLAGVTGHLSIPVLLAVAFATTGGKVSAGVIAVLGAGLVLVVALARREQFARRAVLATVATAVGAAAAYLMLISGVDVAGNIGVGTPNDKAAVFQGLLPFAGPVGLVIGTVILMLATVPRVAGLLPLILDRSWRWRPEVVFTTGTFALGAGALLLLSEGVNDLWFVVSASGPACVVAAVGVGLVAPAPIPLRRRLDARWIVAMASAGVVVVLVALARTADPHMGVRVWGLAIITVGSALLLAVLLSRLVPPAVRAGTRTLLALTVISLTTMGMMGRAFEFTDGSSTPAVWPTAEIPAAAVAAPTPAPTSTPPEPAPNAPAAPSTPSTDPDAVARDVWAAGMWLDADLADDVIVATDRPESLDMTALGARRAYLAGERYQVGLGAKVSAAEVPIRGRISRALDLGPTPETLSGLCAAGVTHLWLEGRGAAVAWATYTEQAYANDSVSVLRLRPDVCP